MQQLKRLEAVAPLTLWLPCPIVLHCTAISVNKTSFTVYYCYYFFIIFFAYWFWLCS